jgi:hypothetical protein
MQATGGLPAILSIALLSAVIAATQLLVVRLLEAPVLLFCLDTLPLPDRFKRPVRRLLALPVAKS